MSELDKLFPINSVITLTEILNQKSMWSRDREFTTHAQIIANRIFIAIFPLDETDELNPSDLENFKKLNELVALAHLDGIGYTVETQEEVYKISGVMISITQLHSLLSLVGKVYDDTGSP